jgi:cytochrome c553
MYSHIAPPNNPDNLTVRVSAPGSETIEMSVRKALILLTMCVPILGYGAAHADHDPASVDLEAGRALAAACAECHGPEGISETPEVPHLAGQHAAYLVTTMSAYRTGVRTQEIMRGVAAELGVQDIANIAAYFASLDRFTYAAEATGGGEPAAAGASEAKVLEAVMEATTPCASCHEEDGNSTEPGTPGVAGQSAQYIETAMRAYRDGGRSEEVMQAFAAELSDPDIELMAGYYASIEPKNAPPPTAGNLAAGARIAADCAACHGAAGNSGDPATPRLAGLDADYLAIAIKAYKEGGRDHEVMKEFVSPLTEADIGNLAAYYATQHPKAPPTGTSLTAEEWAQRCDRCHGPDGNSTDPRFPILAGQSEAYLAEAMRVYHTETRPSSMMQAMSYKLREADFRSLAAYYAGKRGN